MSNETLSLPSRRTLEENRIQIPNEFYAMNDEIISLFSTLPVDSSIHQTIWDFVDSNTNDEHVMGSLVVFLVSERYGFIADPEEMVKRHEEIKAEITTEQLANARFSRVRDNTWDLLSYYVQSHSDTNGYNKELHGNLLKEGYKFANGKLNEFINESES